MSPDDRTQDRLRAVVGADGIRGVDDVGALRVAPASEHAAATLLEAAMREGWSVRVGGKESWSTADHPATVSLSLRHLDGFPYFNPGDLVATVSAGTPVSSVRERLAEHGAWLPIDPPGDDRSVGSVVATGTNGPLQCGFGGLRDQVLGVTVISGDGRVIRPGGRVVKNVAGFDLTKLAIGSFGAFGVVTAVTVRLLTVPRADVTLTTRGQRDTLLQSALRLLAKGLTPGALELFASDPNDAWTLGVRLVGTHEAVEAAREIVLGVMDIGMAELATPDARSLWLDHGRAALDGSTTLRAGAPPTALPALLDLVRHHLPDGWTTVSIFPGGVRWAGTPTPDDVRLFRHQAAQIEAPVTIERAPWRLVSTTGHFGAFREQVGALTQGLRKAFDPGDVLRVPLEAT